MAKIDFDKWLSDGDAIAIRIRSSDLRDFLGLNIFSSGTVEVPQGTVGLVRQEGGAKARLAKAGEKVGGDFELVLVKDRRFPLALSFDGLRSADDYPFSLKVELIMSVDVLNEDALTDFASGLISDSGEATSASVGKLAGPQAGEIIRNFFAAGKAEDLMRGDRSADVEKALRSGLKRTCFENGFDLVEVNGLEISSPDYEKVRDARLGAAMEEERAKRLEIIRQAWVKDQKNEAMSAKEVKEFVKALDHEGALQEIERRKQKAEAEKELQAIMGEKERLKMEFELKNASQVMELLEKAGFRNVFEKFLEIAEKRGASRSGEDLRKSQAHGLRAGSTRRLLAVLGAKILAFDPRRQGHAPAETYDLSGGALGMLRSVRADTAGGSACLLAGAQFGVYLQSEADGFAPKEYRIPGAGGNRGGVNSAVIAGDGLLAAHSEFGIVRWPLSGGEGEFLRKDLTQGETTVRGLRRGSDDTCYFAAGSTVYSLMGAMLEGTPTCYAGADSAVTALWITKAAVFAGTKSGELFRWKIGEPENPNREIAKGVDPVYMIKTALIDGRPCVLVGWKGYGVLAKVLETDSQVQFLSDARIRWVDGEADYVFGVDREGRRILVWKTSDKTRRHSEFVTEERIQDIWVWAGEEEKGGKPPEDGHRD